MFKAYSKIKAKIVEPTDFDKVAVDSCIKGLCESAKADLNTNIVSTELGIQQVFLNFAKENKQEDLLYFKAVYATCGFNLNDDVFIRDEFWAARKSPIWKPVNWQHKETNILGVIYAVQAQDLEGNPLNIENDVTPAKDFELIISGVIYKYQFPEKAKEIKKRSNANELFVSMESWFADFSYALLDNPELFTTASILEVERNSETIQLDKCLKVFGGTGKYNNKKIGRILKGITFGGVGIVDEPANPRSVSVVTASKETVMSEEVKEVAKAVAEATVALKNELDKAQAELASVTAANKENLERLEKLKEKEAKGKQIAEAILAELAGLDLVQAGIVSSVPPEISKIDSALDGGAEALFKAKLAFLTKTGKALAEENSTLKKTIDNLTIVAAQKEKEIADLQVKASELDSLRAKEAEVAALEARKEQDTVRVNEVLALGFKQEVVDALKDSFLNLDSDAYNKWLDEKKIIAGKLSLKHDGGQGTVDAEGKSGEKKAKQEPRFKISVAQLINAAKVEEEVELTEEVNLNKPEVGFASILNKKENK